MTFRQQAARPSLLGLDKLAAEKRAQALASGAIKSEPPSKRVKREPGEDDTDMAANGGVFKGEHGLSSSCANPTDIIVPALPIKRETVRQRPDETPSHGSGLSEEARRRMEARRRERNMPAGPSSNTVISSKDNDAKPTGLGDFQSRLNRNTYDDRGRDRGYNRDDRDRKSWNDAPTPKSVKGETQWDGGSMRVPNRGWDETPRGARDAGRYGKSDGSKGRGWDETPRSVRVKKEFPDLEDGEAMAMNGQEWEEEQVRLDRDWYSYDDEGAVVSFY